MEGQQRKVLNFPVVAAPVPEQEERRIDSEEEEEVEEDKIKKKKSKKDDNLLKKRASAPKKTRRATGAGAFTIVLVVLLTCLCTFVPTLLFRDKIVSTLLFWRNSTSTQQEQQWPIRAHGPVNTTSEPVTTNSTTVQELLQVRAILARHALNTACVCMHHLEYPANAGYNRLQACAVYNDDARQLYFMRNPRLIGFNKGAELVRVRERSLACPVESPVIRQRASGVFIEWDDESQVRHYALFREERAFCLQLAIDEFAGNKHCSSSPSSG